MIKAVIFDLDGVLVSTDDCHYRAWKEMAEQEGIPFDRQINERLRGVSRMASLEIILERASRSYSEEEKASLAARKNSSYTALIQELRPADMLPGASESLRWLRQQGTLLAVGSSSRNTPVILRQIGLEAFFDAVADGNDIQRSKPAPDVFLVAMRRLKLRPEDCLVVEDADAGVEAAKAAGMRVLAVGSAQSNKKADHRAASLENLDWRSVLREQSI